MIDPADPPEVQIRKQQRIIDALMRRADREHELGTSAYAAFQSAIALQGQVWAKARDLERASTELETARSDRERTQKALSEALSVMEGGFALFEDGRLQVSNDRFAGLLPDIAGRVRPGLGFSDYADLAARSRHVSGRGGRRLLREMGRTTEREHATFVLGLADDRWFQWRQQRTPSGSLVILQTEITGIVRQNRVEKDALLDMQAHYLQAAFDNTSLGVGTFSRRGELMIHNDRFRDLLGLSARHLGTGTPFAEILDRIRSERLFADPDLTLLDAWPQGLRAPGGLRQIVRHKGGAVLDLSVSLLPDRGFLVSVADISFEHRATQLLEREVEARTRDLTEANRRLTEQSEVQARVELELRFAKERAETAMSSKTRFLAAASHDLLQPISAAKLLISTLGAKAAGGELAPLVARLGDSFGSIESLLHALLDISRLEGTDGALSPAPVCLGPLMETVTDDLAPLAERKGLRLDVVPCGLWVRSDPRYLLRSIQNLVANAIQYTPEGRVLCGCRRRGERVSLEVWDTGIGISRADQSRIFEEFTRAGNAAPGSGMGLGLSIVERACRQLGHDLSVRSKPRMGSVFSIGMEVCAPGRAAAGAGRARPEGPHAALLDLIVLVVENDPEVLFATVNLLEGAGASVFGTASTAEALAVLADAGLAPDMVIADFQLDGGDTGIAAVRAVRREAGTDVPALLVSAERGAALAEAAARERLAVIAKPVDPDRLLRAVAAACGRASDPGQGPERDPARADQSLR